MTTLERTRRYQHSKYYASKPAIDQVFQASRARVHTGRLILDETFGPDWVEKINWEKLDLDDYSGNDLLAQLWRVYGSGTVGRHESAHDNGRKMINFWYLEEVNYGFALFDSAWQSSHLRELAKMWRSEVGK